MMAILGAIGGLFAIIVIAAVGFCVWIASMKNWN